MAKSQQTAAVQVDASAVYVVKSLVRRDGKNYKPGATLTLNAKDAAHLLRSKSIEKAK